MTTMILEHVPELSLWMKNRGMLIGAGGLSGTMYVEYLTEV